MREITVTTEDVAYIEARTGEVEALLAELPDDQRVAVRGRVLEDRDYDEMAAAEGVSPAAVRQRVKRGLAVLRERRGGDLL
jgi:RNA polymerase sigma-70 factor (ECF subfamily)